MSVHSVHGRKATARSSDICLEAQHAPNLKRGFWLGNVVEMCGWLPGNVVPSEIDRSGVSEKGDRCPPRYPANIVVSLLWDSMEVICRLMFLAIPNMKSLDHTLERTIYSVNDRSELADSRLGGGSAHATVPDFCLCPF